MGRAIQYQIKLEEIIAGVPNVQSVLLPDDWSPNFEMKRSVFNQFYDLIIRRQLCPSDWYRRLHNCTYVGDRLQAKLLGFEKKRLSKYVDRKSLESAVSWSDLGNGPKTSVLGRLTIVGDFGLIIPDESEDALTAIGCKILDREVSRANTNIRRQAAGGSYWNWMRCQTDRDDPVGDVARDIDIDKEFPKDVADYFDMMKYLKRWSGDLDEAVRESWKEYLSQYPARAMNRVPCNQCGNNVSLDSCVIAYNHQDCEFDILHEACSELNSEHSTVVTRGHANREAVDKFVAEDRGHKIDERAVLELEDRLLLSGNVRMNDPGWVYFLQASSSKHIKIGFTSRNVESRVAEMQTGQSDKLIIMAKIPGDRANERSLHQKFAEHRLRGEWFWPHPHLCGYIDSISDN